jgi:hypothetical protein
LATPAKELLAGAGREDAVAANWPYLAF